MSNTRHTKAIEVDAPVKRSIRYLRVSSKRQTDTDADIDPDGNSIDTQRKVTQAKEKSLGLVNVGEYVEPGTSAQTIEKRPVFREMLRRIMEDQDVDCVVIYMRSRIFRNHIDAAITKRQLENLGVKLVSAKEDFGEGYMADAMEAVTDIFNELEARRNGADIKIKMGNKAKNGGTITRTKLGYLNVRKQIDGHQVNTVDIDPERQRYIPLAFELFATGEHTIESLQVALTQAGLRLPAFGKWPARPVSVQTVHNLLRDRYYLGEICYEGVWRKGRHEALVTEELFDRVQHVLDSHSGSGTRERTHPHYLKGLIYCGRCGHRFIVQRAKGNGGVYYYFLCRGKQRHVCDQPYVPVEVIEEAVEEHYGRAVVLPADFRAEVRAGVDAALAQNFTLSDSLRKQYRNRLEALDRKEDYFLDLAAEEGWPKDKLKTKIEDLRRERRSIQRQLDQTEGRLNTGRDIFYRALELLDDPQAMYARSGEQVRSILNKAFFTKLYIEGRKVSEQELREPFDILVGAYEAREQQAAHPRAPKRVATYYRRSGSLSVPETDKRAISVTGDSALGDRSAVIASLLLDLGHSWSKGVLVEVAGIEPASFGSLPGLLRAQPAVFFSAPAVTQASCRRAQSLLDVPPGPATGPGGGSSLLMPDTGPEELPG
jgi:site-specific DNA recombinase